MSLSAARPAVTLARMLPAAPREYFTAVCANCGGEASRSLRAPKTDRPVYCSECFAKMRENG